MSISGIMSSRSQRRFLFTLSLLLIVLCWLGVLIFYWTTSDTRGWNILIASLVGVAVSGMFALFSAFYLYYYFSDPFEYMVASQLLPADIGSALEEIASSATKYKIFVRTGRHFRAVILPLLARNAVKKRVPIRIEVVLLDFRDSAICTKYADFRQEGSFDKQLWSREYVETEVIATIMKLIDASKEAGSFIEIDLFLSKRLSTFRIEGTSDAIVVTREDPTDNAARYKRTDPHFGAFLNEFAWIREEADAISTGGRRLPEFAQMFPDVLGSTLAEAQSAASKGSPYVR